MLPQGTKYSVHHNKAKRDEKKQPYQQKNPSTSQSSSQRIDKIPKIDYFDLGEGKDVINMFPIELKPTTSINQYHVDIIPRLENKYLVYRIVKQVLGDRPIEFLQSGSILYSLQTIHPPQKKQLEKTCVSDNIEYHVTITLATTITVSNRGKDFMQFVNSVLKNAQSKLKLTRIGRNFYNEKTTTEIHDFKLQIWRGTLNTTCLTSKGLALLAEPIYKTMRTETVLSQMEELKNKFQQRADNMIKSAFSRSIVYLTYRKKSVHIEDVAFDMNPLSTFDYQGKKITFAEYYKIQYNISDVDPKQPLLRHVNRKSGKEEYYIPSLCLLTGINQDMKSNFRTMKAIDFVTKKPPNERIRETFGNQMEYLNNSEFKQELEKWGISIVPKMIQMETKTLQGCSIIIGGEVQAEKHGTTGMFKIEGNLLECKSVNKVLVLHQGPKSNDLIDFCNKFQGVCEKMGMNISEMNYTFKPYPQNVTSTVLEDIIRKEGDLSFIFMITKNKTSREYATFKERTITTLGIPSQCIIEKNIGSSEKQGSILNNIAIEMNAKLGGIPWKTSIPMKPYTMIVGMDVNHSGEVYYRTKSSVVGFVSSYDSKACHYFAQIQKQKPGVELVENIKLLMENAIEIFKRENKSIPKHIIFYRDGVGYGQEDIIYNEEISAIQQVCRKYSIPLNFILVLKRINNRIYAGLDKEGRNFGNLKPGTVLNGNLLSADPTEMSFFLQSHHVETKQGTATPTKYKILLNESGFNQDYYQNISYKLCHLYYNRLGISSVPAPCMLAHRVAFLHGQSNIGSPHNNLKKTQYFL